MGRKGVQRVVILSPGPFPATIDYPSARPAMVVRDLGYDVHVVEVVPGQDRSRKEFDGVQLWRVPSPRAALARVIRLRPDLLFLEGTRWLLLALPAARKRWVRASKTSPRPLVALAERLLIRMADAVTFTNPADVHRWRVSPQRVVELPYPVDLQFWAQPIQRDPGFWSAFGLPEPAGEVLSYAAQIKAGKGHFELVAALAPLLRERPNVMLVFAGFADPPELREQLLAVIAEHGVQDNVVLLGGVAPAERLRQLYAWSTIHVLNTVSETQCLVIYESLAAGAPNLIPAIPELTSAFPALLSHRNGEELLVNVRRLLDDPSLREAQIAAGQGRLAWADVAIHDSQLRDVVPRLIGEPNRSVTEIPQH